MRVNVIFTKIDNVQIVLVDTQNELLIARCMRKIFTSYLNSSLGILVDLKKLKPPLSLSSLEKTNHPP